LPNSDLVQTHKFHAFSLPAPIMMPPSYPFTQMLVDCLRLTSFPSFFFSSKLVSLKNAEPFEISLFPFSSKIPSSGSISTLFQSSPTQQSRSFPGPLFPCRHPSLVNKQSRYTPSSPRPPLLRENLIPQLASWRTCIFSCPFPPRGFPCAVVTDFFSFPQSPPADLFTPFFFLISRSVQSPTQFSLSVPSRSILEFS